MSIFKKIEVTVSGVVLNLKADFKLYEKVGNHACFKIQVEEKDISSSSSSTESVQLLENSKSYLGEECWIKIEEFDISSNSSSGSKEPFSFKGIFTDVQSSRVPSEHNTQEQLLIIGHSCDVLLSGRSDLKSYLEENLSTIVSETVKQVDSQKMNTVVSLTADPVIGYSVQQGLNSYTYLQQLAAKYGEYLLYATDTLYFGKPDLGESVELELNQNLKSMRISLKTSASGFSLQSMDYFKEELVSSSSSSSGSAASGSSLMAFSNEVSASIYPEVTQVNYSDTATKYTQKELDTAATIQKKADEQSRVVLEACSTEIEVSLGKTLLVKHQDHNYGEFRVIEVVHHCDVSGRYTNEFKAISTELDVYPHTNIHCFPKSDSQLAKVVDTQDPDGLSRLQVQFLWQEPLNQTTPWLRMQTPYAGTGKGLHFLPEVGEQVLVGFIDGNAERPYVSGAFYTGVNKPDQWQTDANNIKALRSRSGHTIELDDTEGEEQIRIYDNEVNAIVFDLNNKSLTISTEGDLNLVGNTVNIQAKEGIEIASEDKIAMAAKKGCDILSDDELYLQSKKDLNLKSSKNLALDSENETGMISKKVNIKGDMEVNLSATKTNLKADAMLQINGKLVKIN